MIIFQNDTRIPFQVVQHEFYVFITGEGAAFEQINPEILTADSLFSSSLSADSYFYGSHSADSLFNDTLTANSKFQEG